MRRAEVLQNSFSRVLMALLLPGINGDMTTCFMAKARMAANQTMWFKQGVSAVHVVPRGGTA
jgi:hypothetical protein